MSEDNLPQPSTPPPSGDDLRSGDSHGTPKTSLPCRLVLWSIFLVALVVGVVFQVPIVRGLEGLIPPASSHRKVLYWTSPHDPSRRFDHPGKDAMGMDLVPVYEGKQVAKAPLIEPEIQESEFTTASVEKGPLVRTLRTVSTVDYAESRIGEVTLKVDAWLEKLYVDYEGQSVQKGNRLFDVYSPDLLAAMQDLMIAARYVQTASPTLRQETERNLQDVHRRLRFWDVSAEQLAGIEKSRTVPRTVSFASPFSGIVIDKQAFEGKFVPAGDLLYRIADISKVWVYVYVYQDEIHCVYEGQPATLTVPELPGRSFSGKVVYIYPYLEPKIRAVKVRLEFENPDLALKPDMFVHVDLAPHEMGDGLKIPKRVVLDTGRRQLVYVVKPDHTFEPREIITGMSLDGGMVELLSGLQEGETVVASSQFLLDSESRLRTINRKFEPLPERPQAGHEGMSGMEGMREMEGMSGMEGMPGMKPMAPTKGKPGEGMGTPPTHDAAEIHEHQSHQQRE